MAQGITYPSASLKAMFNPMQVHVEFVVDKVEMGQVFLSVVYIPPVIVIPPVLHIHSFIHSSIRDAI
jgi:hypothetical protein